MRLPVVKMTAPGGQRPDGLHGGQQQQLVLKLH